MLGTAWTLKNSWEFCLFMEKNIEHQLPEVKQTQKFLHRLLTWQFTHIGLLYLNSTSQAHSSTCPAKGKATHISSPGSCIVQCSTEGEENAIFIYALVLHSQIKLLCQRVGESAKHLQREKQAWLLLRYHLCHTKSSTNWVSLWIYCSTFTVILACRKNNGHPTCTAS